MRASTLVAGVDAEIEEVHDVVVPGLKVGTTGATALSPLVHRDELVVVKLKKRNHTLALAVRP